MLLTTKAITLKSASLFRLSSTTDGSSEDHSPVRADSLANQPWRARSPCPDLGAASDRRDLVREFHPGFRNRISPQGAGCARDDARSTRTPVDGTSKLCKPLRSQRNR